MHLHFLRQACEGSIKICLKFLMCVDHEEWIFTIQLASTFTTLRNIVG